MKETPGVQFAGVDKEADAAWVVAMLKERPELVEHGARMWPRDEPVGWRRCGHGASRSRMSLVKG
jgi:hypothetical protein